MGGGGGVAMLGHYHRGQNYYKNTFQSICFGTINFIKITKQSLYKANSFACSLANRDKPLVATLQRKCSGGRIFVVITKIITKRIVPRNYFCNNFSQDYVSVGLHGSREQGNLRKCSPSALKSALRNRGALASAPKSALEGALPVVLYPQEHPREHSREHSREHPDF